MRDIRFNYGTMMIFYKTVPIALFLAFQSLGAAPSTEKKNQTTCEQILSSLTTVSFDSVLTENDAHPAFDRLKEIYAQRSSRAQARIDSQMRDNHLRKEMSFQVKNPKTGFYDQFVAVPVNAHIAPIKKTDYDRMVRSTGPVLRALRSLLQRVYSQRVLTVESLGLENLPAAEAELALRVIKESIYLEPAFVAPQMAEYPFLAVSGFDGAIVDPKKPKNVFFEMNLGTPSGLSNNGELLEDLKSSDPEVYAAIEPYLPKDTTYQLLRETIESSAAKWTGREGITVVISPGIYNGAHPDVATIAKRAGLPLVKSSDLYEDADGNIRLNTGSYNEHPVVTGVYNRMEESFFFQSSSENIPLISPNYTDHSSLAQKTGLNLKSGVIYQWVYDDSGAIVDVERDEQGQPLLAEVWDTIGQDPKRPTASRGSFAKAVLNRRLFVSNLGGRVVDDKRLFRIVSEYLAERKPGLQIAGPVAGFPVGEISKLFADPDQFVIKAPANSGGVGIYFPRTMSQEDKLTLLEQVRQAPGEYEIQYVSPIATLPSADGKSFQDVAMDLRIFVMMDENGAVSAGPNSILLRTAPPGGLYSNTSRGGGYGIGVVLDNKAHRNIVKPNPEKEIVYSEADLVAGERTITALKELQSVLRTSLKQPVDEMTSKQLSATALSLSFDLRNILHRLPPGQLSLPSRLREFAELDPIDHRAIRRLLRQMRGNLERLSKERPVLDPLSPVVHELNRKITYRPLEEPVIAYYFPPKDNRYEQKYEMAEIVAVDSPEVQQMIDFVKANGGEVRHMNLRVLSADDRRLVDWEIEPSYFWVNLDPQSKSYLIPVIAIDLNRDRALSSLSHEMEHFKIWLAAYQRLQAEGLDTEAAAKAAVDEVLREDMIVYGERLAVAAEMEADRKYKVHEFNRARSLHRPTNYWEYGYINRITYPEFEAVRAILRQNLHFGTPLDLKTLDGYLLQMVTTALEIRRKANLRLLIEGQTEAAEKLLQTDVFSLLAKPYGIERLRTDKTLRRFKRHVKRICNQLQATGLDRCG